MENLYPYALEKLISQRNIIVERRIGKMTKTNINHDPEKIYFMGDLHYQHKNVISLDSRPFEDLQAMEEYIDTELSTKLDSDCILFDLGDMFFGTRENKFQKLLSSIPCPIYKIFGNHDKQDFFLKHYDNFKGFYDILSLMIGEDYKITLSHYPILDFPYMYHGGLALFGHTHGHLDKFVDNIPNLMLDIGFSSQFSKSRGTFIHSLPSIIDEFRRKTGGKDFKTWAAEEYHGERSLWN